MATALITGASSGLGEQFAYALGREHYDLVLAARREDRLAAVAGRARTLGAGTVRVIRADLGLHETPAALYQQLTGDGVQIDYLVNNAGFGTSGKFHQLPPERELEEIELNVTSLVATTRLFLPAMVERRRGTVINVASTAAFQATPYMATYGATKAFVLSFSEAVAAELRGTGRDRDGVLSGAGADGIPESREQRADELSVLHVDRCGSDREPGDRGGRQWPFAVRGGRGQQRDGDRQQVHAARAFDLYQQYAVAPVIRR